MKRKENHVKYKGLIKVASVKKSEKIIGIVTVGENVVIATEKHIYTYPKKAR